MPEGAFARIGLAGDDPVGTVGQLERTLGRFGFQWLCACAVYPGLRFPLSVHLGRCLADAFHRAPPNEDEHLALFRLPWFRSGWMPEDLRLALIQSLEPVLRPVVRAAIEALLFNALDDNKRDPDAAPRLDFARPPRSWRSVLHAWMEGAPAGAPARDAIFVHYMMGRVPRPADLRLNRRLARLFGARLAGWFDRRTLTWGALALATTVAVWLFADGVIKPLFTEEQVQVVLALVRDSNVELQDESTGATIAVLRGHTDGVTSVAFSPDGRVLATGSLDGTADLWEVATGKQIAVLRGHTDGVTSVAFSPDGRVLATGSRDNTARLWEVATGKQIAVLRGHTDGVTSVAFSPDGRVLATGSLDGTADLWEVATGKQIAVLRGEVDDPLSVRLLYGAAYFLSRHLGRLTVDTPSIETGKQIAVLRGHTDGVTSVAFSPDGRVLATGSRDGTADLWEVATGKQIATLHGQNGEVTSVAFSPDGARVKATDASRVVCSWDARSRALISCSAPPIRTPPTDVPSDKKPLGEVGPKAAAAVPALIEALKDQDVGVRNSAARALGAIGPQAAPAVPALIEALKDQDVGVRNSAARALGAIGPQAAPAVPALIEALKDQDAGVRNSVARALSEIAPRLRLPFPPQAGAPAPKKEPRRRVGRRELGGRRPGDRRHRRVGAPRLHAGIKGRELLLNELLPENGGGKVCHGSGGIVPLPAE